MGQEQLSRIVLALLFVRAGEISALHIVANRFCGANVANYYDSNARIYTQSDLYSRCAGMRGELAV